MKFWRENDTHTNAQSTFTSILYQQAQILVMTITLLFPAEIIFEKQVSLTCSLMMPSSTCQT